MEKSSPKSNSQLFEGSLLPTRIFKPKSNLTTSDSIRKRFLLSQKEKGNKFLNERRNLEWTHTYESNIKQTTKDISLEPQMIQYDEISLKIPIIKNSEKCPNNILNKSSIPDTKKQTLKNPKQTRPNIFSNQLIIYDWLIEPPSDLYQNWLFCVRPEGTRCIISIYDDYGIVRDKYGIKFASFPIPLRLNGITILEAIYNSDLKTYFIVDALIWNDCELANSTAECRFFFLYSRVSESDYFHSIQYLDEGISIIKLLEYCECNKEKLLEAYYSKYEFQTDSILLVHKEARYLPGFNPLWLCWRDSHISRFSIDTEYSDQSDFSQIVCLELMSNGDLRTADNLIVGKLIPGSLPKRFKGKTSLVKVKISGVDLNSTKLLGLTIVGKAFERRIYPEPYNRIVMQYIQRMPEPIINFTDIVNSVKSCEQMDIDSP